MQMESGWLIESSTSTQILGIRTTNSFESGPGSEKQTRYKRGVRPAADERGKIERIRKSCLVLGCVLLAAFAGPVIPFANPRRSATSSKARLA